MSSLRRTSKDAIDARVPSKPPPPPPPPPPFQCMLLKLLLRVVAGFIASHSAAHAMLALLSQDGEGLSRTPPTTTPRGMPLPPPQPPAAAVRAVDWEPRDANGVMPLCTDSPLAIGSNASGPADVDTPGVASRAAAAKAPPCIPLGFLPPMLPQLNSRLVAAQLAGGDRQHGGGPPPTRYGCRPLSLWPPPAPRPLLPFTEADDPAADAAGDASVAAAPGEGDGENETFDAKRGAAALGEGVAMGVSGP
jgi:hypothetical protein